MTSRKTVLYAAALAGALTLGLSGCNAGEKDPTPTASPTGSASSTESPSPTSSGSGAVPGSPSPSVSVSVPAAARAHTEAGAIEFAKFYLMEMDRAFIEADGSVVSALAGPSCEGCDVTIKGVEELKTEGLHQVRPSLTVVATNPLPGGDADNHEIQVQTRAAEVDIVNSAGKVDSSTDSGPAVYRFALRWTGGQWTVLDLGLEG